MRKETNFVSNTIIYKSYISRLVLSTFILLFCLTTFPLSAFADSTNLVGYWKFDEGAGTTAVDSSTYGNNGTLVGSGVTYSNVQVAPITASNPYSLHFNGASGTGVVVPDSSSLEMTSALTAMAWIYWDGTGGDNVVFDKSNRAGGDTPNYRLILKSDGRLALWNGFAAGYSSGPTVQANQWTLVNFTIDSGVTSFYINGMTAGTANIGVGAVTSYNLYIGRDAIGRYFHGYIDEARLYNRALTPDEISGIASGGAGPDTTPTLSGCSTMFYKRGNTMYTNKCGVETVFSVDPVLLPAVTTVNSSGVPFASLVTGVVGTTTNSIASSTGSTTTSVASSSIGVSESVLATSTVSASVATSTYMFTQDLKYKDENPDVLMLQRFLVAQGYLTVTPNGYFGKATKVALMKFQNTHSLPVSGFFGPMTRVVIHS
jgi:peptidoglycan hydrolase-like protein with peptidoglycan-binding domain